MRTNKIFTGLPVLLALAAVLVFVATAQATDEIPAGMADITITGDVDDGIGGAVAVGDFNGDSIADLFVGAPGG